MRAVIAAIVLLAVSAMPAGAESLYPPAWYSRAAALAHSLLGGQAEPDQEVIAPPANIDPQMALRPPGAPGSLRIIPPPEPAEPQ